MENYVKFRYQTYLIDPAIRFILRKFPNVTANQLTLLSCILAGFTILFGFLDWSIMAVIFLLLAGYFDSLDGALARTTKTESLKGAFLDILAERFIEFCAIFSIYSFEPNERGFFCILMLGAILLCISVKQLMAIVTPRVNKEGYGNLSFEEKAGSFLFFCLMMLVSPLFMPLSLIFIVLIVWVTVRHVRQFLMQ